MTRFRLCHFSRIRACQSLFISRSNTLEVHRVSLPQGGTTLHSVYSYVKAPELNNLHTEWQSSEDIWVPLAVAQNLFLLWMSSFTHLHLSSKAHPKCHLLQEAPPPHSTPNQTRCLLQLFLVIDHTPSCFYFLETISGHQSHCALPHKSQFCASLNSAKSCWQFETNYGRSI